LRGAFVSKKSDLLPFILLGSATKEYAGVFGFNAGLLGKLSPPNPDSNQL
jgi:hypothetical protein